MIDELKFERVQAEPPLYDLFIDGALVGARMTLDEVIATIAGSEENEMPNMQSQ